MAVGTSPGERDGSSTARNAVITSEAVLTDRVPLRHKGWTLVPLITHVKGMERCVSYVVRRACRPFGPEARDVRRCREADPADCIEHARMEFLCAIGANCIQEANHGDGGD